MPLHEDSRDLKTFITTNYSIFVVFLTDWLQRLRPENYLNNIIIHGCDTDMSKHDKALEAAGSQLPVNQSAVLRSYCVSAQ